MAKKAVSKTATKAAAERVPDCCRRKSDGGEVYDYWDEHFRFDVDRANALVLDGREPVELDEASTEKSVEKSEICEAHVGHVDAAKPGIIAHVECLADDGEVIKGQVLIDGNHRALRCLQLKQPFTVYLLTERESKAILLRSPQRTFAKIAPPASPKKAAVKKVATKKAVPKKAALKKPATKKTARKKPSPRPVARPSK